VFNATKAKILNTETLYQNLRKDKDGEHEVDYIEQKITKRNIGDALSAFEIKSRPHRYKSGAPTKCWFREDFEEMWERFV
jgi:hypothetical protein